MAGGLKCARRGSGQAPGPWGPSPRKARLRLLPGGRLGGEQAAGGDSCWSGRREQVGTRWHHAAPADPSPPPHPVPPRAQACCQGSSPRYSPAHPAVRDQSGSSQGAPPTAGGARCPPWTSWHPLAPPAPAHPSRGASGETPGAGLRRRGGGAAPAPSVPLLRPHPCVLEFSPCCLVPQIVCCCSHEGAKSAMAYVAVSVTSLPDSPLFGLFVF